VRLTTDWVSSTDAFQIWMSPRIRQKYTQTGLSLPPDEILRLRLKQQRAETDAVSSSMGALIGSQPGEELGLIRYDTVCGPAGRA
jgi:hypothetical protein